jgi:hypothetical protein
MGQLSMAFLAINPTAREKSQNNTRIRKKLMER